MFENGFNEGFPQGPFQPPAIGVQCDVCKNIYRSTYVLVNKKYGVVCPDCQELAFRLLMEYREDLRIRKEKGK